jgi:hypothetical protein
MLRLVMLALLAATPALADSSIRCGTKLVYTGSNKEEVRADCGSPTAVDHWTEDRLHGDVHEFVEVEEWTYNRGPQQFIQIVRFEKGRMCSVKDGDYGH